MSSQPLLAKIRAEESHLAVENLSINLPVFETLITDAATSTSSEP
ncbi:MAG: hypothetical protein AVDCRST_MAG96-972 [uncultured Segetibacter sp.]|uniref:Uncharacterized protein n=1 Tax=uncultured Segetibacter sp. TaxID=481133 RepID=A0A6J4RYI6_9BACT|nr:MAG: hypothetical protein AVDCRST_MAG96-972 [uncultured Segetibacter sp.]